MSTASLLPTAASAKRRLSVRRLAAWLASRAGDPKAGLWLVSGFATLHAVLWTLILVNLKAGQDVHMDVAEAYAWGQKFLLGYGKHPPLSGWIAGLWFMAFPAADWATYALAMATVSVGMVFNEDSTLDVSALLAQADQTLYHAKERGRNRVEIASLELVRQRKQQADAREAPAGAAMSAARHSEV